MFQHTACLLGIMIALILGYFCGVITMGIVYTRTHRSVVDSLGDQRVHAYQIAHVPSICP